MSLVLDVIYTKLEQIENNPKLFLDMGFMTTIYKEFENRIDPFKDYLIYMLSSKKIATKDRSGITKHEWENSKIDAYYQLQDESFFPTDKDNEATNDLVLEMAKVGVRCWMNEFCDKKKATSDYLSNAEGKFSWYKTTKEEQDGIAKIFLKR